MSRRRLAAQVSVAATLLAAFVFRDWIEAQADVVTALSTTVETPGLTWAVREVTRDPSQEEISVGGTPTVVVRPGRGDAWPAVVFVNGATPHGRHHPDVQAFARGLARAGYLVLIPELPGLREGEVTEETLDVTLAVARETVEWPEARDGDVGFVGVSVGATLALLAAAERDLAGRTTVVSGIAPYTDLRKTVQLATTDQYRDGDELVRYETRDFLALVVARSLVFSLPPGDDREALLAVLPTAAENPDDPLADLRARGTDGLGPDAAALVDLLANRDPARFDALYADLPETVHETVARLSPIEGAERIAARVELASAPHDDYFPPAESRALVARAPDGRLTVTRALAHADLALDPRLLRDFLRFDGFAVRTLRAASG